MNNTRQEIEEMFDKYSEENYTYPTGQGLLIEELTKREADIRREVQAEKEQYLEEDISFTPGAAMLTGEESYEELVGLGIPKKSLDKLLDQYADSRLEEYKKTEIHIDISPLGKKLLGKDKDPTLEIQDDYNKFKESIK